LPSELFDGLELVEPKIDPVQAFRDLHVVIEAVADVLAVAGGPAGAVERELRDVPRRRTRLNETVLQVTDRLEQRDEPCRGSWTPNSRLNASPSPPDG